MRLIMQRKPEDCTLLNVARLQREYRETFRVPESEESADSLSLNFDKALQEATQLMGFDKPVQQSKPQPAPKPKREQEPAPVKRVKCETHKEIVFTFSDSTSMASCTHDDCMWGYGHHKQKGLQWRKTHSDRLPHSLIEVDEQETEPEELEVELSLDDVRELSVESVIQPLEDRDEDELEVAEPELGTDDEDEPQDEAESFEDGDCVA